MSNGIFSVLNHSTGGLVQIVSSQNFAFQTCTICKQSADIVSFFCQSLKMELFLLLNFIYGGEYLHSGKLASSGGDFLLFCQINIENSGELLLQVSKSIRVGWGIRNIAYRVGGIRNMVRNFCG